MSILDTMKSFLHHAALTISQDTKYSRHTKCIYCSSVQNWLCCVTSMPQVAGQTALLGPRCYYSHFYNMWHNTYNMGKKHLTSFRKDMSFGRFRSNPHISFIQFSKQQTKEVKLWKRQLPTVVLFQST